MAKRKEIKMHVEVRGEEIGREQRLFKEIVSLLGAVF